jgi:hypothetical protein
MTLEQLKEKYEMMNNRSSEGIIINKKYYS